jgi:hypothetical protein
MHKISLLWKPAVLWLCVCFLKFRMGANATFSGSVGRSVLALSTLSGDQLVRLFNVSTETNQQFYIYIQEQEASISNTTLICQKWEASYRIYIYSFKVLLTVTKVLNFSSEVRIKYSLLSNSSSRSFKLSIFISNSCKAINASCNHVIFMNKIAFKYCTTDYSIATKKTKKNAGYIANERAID